MGDPSKKQETCYPTSEFLGDPLIRPHVRSKDTPTTLVALQNPVAMKHGGDVAENGNIDLSAILPFGKSKMKI